MSLYKPPKWLLKFLGEEDRLTIQCANLMRLNNLCFHHTFNEGKRTHTQQQKVTGFGVLKGIPDFLIFHPSKGYNGLAVELKVKYKKGGKNYCSPAQKQAQDRMTHYGWKAVTVWDFEEFKTELKNYFDKK